jgi:hypothetical protein
MAPLFLFDRSSACVPDVRYGVEKSCTWHAILLFRVFYHKVVLTYVSYLENILPVKLFVFQCGYRISK